MAVRVIKIITQEIILKPNKCVTWKATAEEIVTAAKGKVKAHHDIKNLIFVKLLYIVISSATKKYDIKRRNTEKISQLAAILIYEMNPTAGGARSIKNVGMNFSGS